MKIQIDREKQIILLKWLKKGEIDTLEMKELHNGSNYFEELMKSLPDDPDFERKTPWER